MSGRRRSIGVDSYAEGASCGAEPFDRLGSSPQPPVGIWSLTVREVSSLDCALLVVRYPGLADLSLSGTFGVLAQASSLNQLASLKRLFVHSLFGMGRPDCLLPDRVPALEFLGLHNIPYAYAAAMRARWRPQIPNGTLVDITGARKPEWLAENLDNPLRDWDGRGHISRSHFAKAVSQYKATRRAALAALSGGDSEHTASRLAQIGREYGEAFNRLDSRTPFIETEEREELLAALDVIVSDAEAMTGRNLSSARQSLTAAVEEIRRW